MKMSTKKGYILWMHGNRCEPYLTMTPPSLVTLNTHVGTVSQLVCACVCNVFPFDYFI